MKKILILGMTVLILSMVVVSCDKGDTCNHEWEVTKAATATETGIETCKNCGETKSIPKTGGDPNCVHEYEWVITTPATSTLTAIESYKCKKCGGVNGTRGGDSIGTVTKFQGTWSVINEWANMGNPQEKYVYKFVGDTYEYILEVKFAGSDWQEDETTTGTFEFDDTTITFTITGRDRNWTANYVIDGNKLTLTFDESNSGEFPSGNFTK